MRAVFFDVDTQIDFMFPSGALYVPGAEAILPNVAALNRYASERGHQLISTTDAHAEDDPEFKIWPAHCVIGTVGQQKPAVTLGGSQNIIEKCVYDMFTNKALPSLLDEVGAERYVVYGVVTEVCVKCAVDGLLKRSPARIEIVTDAIKAFSEEAGSKALAEFAAAGAVLTTTAAVLRA